MNKKRQKNQRGSALLISLGILSLALILAMSFAFSARTSRQIAKVNADITRAALMVITAEDRILAAMKLAFGHKGRYLSEVGMADSDVDCLYPNSAAAAINFNTNSWTDSDGHVQHYAKPSGTADGDGNNPDSILRQYSSYYNAIASQLPSGQTFVEGYQPVYKNSDGTGTIIGRIAYVLLDETQKYDINRFQDIQLDSSSHNPVAPIIATGEYNLASLGTAYTDTTHFFYQMGLTLAGNTTLTHTNKQRLGVLPQEIWYSNRSDYQPTMRGFGNLTRLPWQSYTHLYMTKGAFDYAKFTFFSPKEPESFAGISASGNFTDEYHRFDLTGFEVGGTDYWKSSDITVTSLTAGSREAFGKESDSSFASTKATCIYSLAKMKDKNGEDVSKHVAANLIDYADNDNYTTLDESFSFTSPESPAYCGNEKVAYISEIPIRFYVQRVRDPDDNYNILVNVTGGMELANVFKLKTGESIPVGQLALRIEGSYSATYSDGTEWKSGDFAPPVATDSGWMTNTSHAGVLAPSDTYKQFVFTTDSGTGVKSHDFATFNLFQENCEGIVDSINSSQKNAYLLNLEFIVKKVVAYHAESLGNLEKVYDLAYWEGTKSITCILPGSLYNSGATSAIYVNNSDQDIYLYASLEVNDPRCNHRAACWDWHNNSFAQGSEDFDYASKCSSWESINDNTKAILETLSGESDATGYDKEKTAAENLDLQDISTNYIANRSNHKILSFWELGAIHRAEPFCTIRLSKYHAYSDTEDVTYANGDAILLDQVKIGPAKFSYGKFNCNCQDDGNFGYFRPGLKPDDTYDDICANNWNDIQCVTLDAHSVSFSRGFLADHFHFKTDSPNYIDTDCQAEAVIGRTANLFSTRSNSYTIFIVAQSLQQLDNAGITSSNWNDVKQTITNPTSMGSNYFSILGTAIWQLGVVRDAWKNEFSVVYRENLVK